MKPIIFLLAYMIPISGFAQKVIAAATKQVVVYVGVPNPIDIAVEGYMCNELTATANDGELTPAGSDCSYNLVPARPGTTTVIITEKKTGKELGRVPFKTNRIPNPTALVAGKTGDVIKKSLLRAQLGVSALKQDFDFDVLFMVSEFEVSVVRNNKTIYAEKHNGALFSNSTRAMFDKLEGQDEVRIENIIAFGPDILHRELQPIVFTITQQ